jgi:hypothetical protein
MHRDDHGKDAAKKRDQLTREVAEDDARIFVATRGVEVSHTLRKLDLSASHRFREESLFRPGVAQHCGGRHLQLAGDVGERCAFEPLAREDAPRDVQKLLPLNRGRPSHL